MAEFTSYCRSAIYPPRPTMGEARALVRDGLRLAARGAALWTGALAGGILRTCAMARASRELQEMDDRLLHDIGLRRDDIDHAVRHGRPAIDDRRP